MNESSFVPLTSFTISTSDPLPEAGRKILAKYFQDMQHHEPIARVGEDIEGVHKMRVAIRRIRSLYRVLAPYLPPIYQVDFPEFFRHTARTLGAVRDLDVFLERIQGYIATSLDGDPTLMQGLLRFKQSELHAERVNLLTWLDSSHYQELTLRFELLLQQPTSVIHLYGKKTRILFAYQVNQWLPLLLYERYCMVRRYESVLDERDIPTIHRLRVDAKRLRYTLDAFQEVLGEPGKFVIGELKIFQEVLGDLNDMAVAIQLLNVAYDGVGHDQQAGVVQYREFCQAALAQHLSQVQGAWATFQRQEVKEALAAAVAAL